MPSLLPPNLPPFLAPDLLLAALDQVPEAMFILDPDGTFRHANRSACRLLGRSLEEVVGTDLRNAVDPETREAAEAALERIRQGSPRETREGWIQGERPAPRWFHCVMGPIQAEGAVVGVVLMCRDDTEHRARFEALRANEERFQALQLNTPDALFWVRVLEDGEFLLEGMNPSGERFTGLRSEVVAGQPFRTIFPPGVADLFSRHCREVLAARHPIVKEETIPFPAGPRHLNSTLVPVEDASGRIHRIVGSARDRTQARRMEEALRQSQKLEGLGVMAGGIAHDFNNLLTAIMGNLNLAQFKLPGDSPALPHLVAVEDTVIKASELTRQMLAYAGRGRFAIRPLQISGLVAGLAHLLRAAVPKGARLVMDLREDLPAMEGDASQIQQVILSLVTNASEAMEGREGLIRVATFEATLGETAIQSEFPAQGLVPGTFVGLEVEDEGVGMTPEILARIFDPFFSTKTRSRGLGLSAMMGILKGHRAGVKVRTAPGEGSAFQIVFPASQASVPLPTPAPAATDTLGGRVLLVDDEPVILESIGCALEDLGFRVTSARDGQDALERFRESAPDVVIMDLTMPRMDGATAFRHMQELDPGVPVILSSGYDRQALEGTRPAAFVQKPYRFKELEGLLREVLARRA